MRTSRGSLLLLLAMLIFSAPALAVQPAAEELKMKLTLAGAGAGDNTYREEPDGKFTSITHLSLGGQVIESTITGQWTDGKLASFTLDQSVGKNSAQIVFANGKADITSSSGKKESKEVKPDTLLFAQFHPQLMRVLATITKAEPQDLTVLMVDSGAELKSKLSFKGRRTVRHGAENVSAAEVILQLAGQIDIHFLLDGSKRTLALDVPAQRFQILLEGWSDLFVDPTARFPELSQPTQKVRTEKAVKVRMRDRVELVADIVRPDAEGKFPVILSRTPYGRATTALEGDWWAKRGYIFIAQDCRGRHDSGGEWQPMVNERKDGYDTIDWIAKQSWSSGKVGMIGGSYGGYVQWAAAVERHPALACIVPQVSPPDAFYNLPYDHGPFFLWGAVWWGNIVREKITDLTRASKPLPHPEKLLTLPLSKIPQEVLGAEVPFFDNWLRNDRPDAYAGFNYQADMAKVRIPALHISGWWDGDGIGTRTNWQIVRSAKLPNQWLLYGPWSHAFNTSSKFGDQDYGASAILEIDSLYLRWFDTWLKGKDVGIAKVPRVRAFLTGANEWRDLNDWPDSRAREKTLYLGAASPANGKNSGGQLLDAPTSESEPDRYTYNPAAATIAKQYLQASPGEASTVVKLDEKDSDQLLYRTEPLKEPMDLTGPISLDLYFSTTAKDTDFFATLVDVDEKGVLRMIGMPGKISAKWVSGWKAPRLVTPGKVYKAKIELWDTAHRFLPGHRAGLLIASSMFPLYARNLNTGEPIKDAVRMVAAHETIYHDRSHPSALHFYLMPASSQPVTTAGK